MKDLLKALSRKGARETLKQLVESPKRFKDLAGAHKSRRKECGDFGGGDFRTVG